MDRRKNAGSQKVGSLKSQSVESRERKNTEALMGERKKSECNVNKVNLTTRFGKKMFHNLIRNVNKYLQGLENIRLCLI